MTCVGWLSVHNSQKPKDGPFVQNENTAHVHTTEQVNPCSVTCSPAALPSLLLPLFWVQPGWALCRLSATTTLQTVSQNFYCSNWDFWFRHHTGFLWCLRPAVGSVFSTPECLHGLVQERLSRSTKMQCFSHCTMWYLFDYSWFAMFVCFLPWVKIYLEVISRISYRESYLLSMKG